MRARRATHRGTASSPLALALLLLLCAAKAQASDVEVPFITTPDAVTRAMLDLAGVNDRDTLIDLGSGDGRIVITAARLHGARGLGVEIVPDLVRRSKEAALKAGVADKVQFVEQDLFNTALEQATVITMYLLPEVNLQLRPRLLKLKPGTRIVSHDWDMGEWKPDRTLSIDVPDKVVGRERISRVHLWLVPAQVGGAWCGQGNSVGQRLDIQQAFQEARLSWRAQPGQPAQNFTARLRGASLSIVERPSPWSRFEFDEAGRLLARTTEFQRCTEADDRP